MSKNTLTNAYILGFCKTAEALKIDPSRLLKVALYIPGVSRNVRTFLEAVNRYPANAAVMQAGMDAINNGVSRGLASKATKVIKSLGRKGMKPPMFSYTKPVLTPEQTERAVLGSLRNTVGGRRDLFTAIGRMIRNNSSGNSVTFRNVVQELANAAARNSTPVWMV